MSSSVRDKIITQIREAKRTPKVVKETVKVEPINGKGGFVSDDSIVPEKEIRVESPIKVKTKKSSVKKSNKKSK